MSNSESPKRKASRRTKELTSEEYRKKNSQSFGKIQDELEKLGWNGKGGSKYVLLDERGKERKGLITKGLHYLDTERSEADDERKRRIDEAKTRIAKLEEEIVTRNSGLPMSICCPKKQNGKTSNQLNPDEQEELKQICYLEFIECVHRYEPDDPRGATLATYAETSINCKIKGYYKNLSDSKSMASLDAPITTKNDENFLVDEIPDCSAVVDERVIGEMMREHRKKLNSDQDALDEKIWEEALSRLTELEKIVCCSSLGFDTIDEVRRTRPDKLKAEDCLPEYNDSHLSTKAKESRLSHARSLANKINEHVEEYLIPKLTPTQTLLLERKVMTRLNIPIPSLTFDLYCMGFLPASNTTLHSDYWLLDMLALRLFAITPKADEKKSWRECYNAILGMPLIDSKKGKEVIKGRSNAKDGIETVVPLNKLLEKKRAKKALSTPEESVSIGENAIRESRNDGTGLWSFFFTEGTSEEAREFVLNLREVLENDSKAMGKDDFLLREARISLVLFNLNEALSAKKEGKDSSAVLSQTIKYLLSWLQVEEGEDASSERAERGIITGGGEHFAVEEEDAPVKKKPRGLIIRASRVMSKGRMEPLDQIEVINPLEKGVVGFGHLFTINGGKPIPFSKASECRRKNLPGIFAGVKSAYGIVNLPAQQVDNKSRKPDEELRALDSISRYHCILVSNVFDGGWRLFDLGSSNGTLVIRKGENGAVSKTIAGLGENNRRECINLNIAVDDRGNPISPIEGFKQRTGAIIRTADEDGNLMDSYQAGVALSQNDEIWLGFALQQNDNGTIEFVKRAGGCVIKVDQLV